MSNDEGMTKHEVQNAMTTSFGHLVIRRCFELRHSGFVISRPRSGRDHICSITLSPNCEHLNSIALAIRRAKSYVTRLLVIAPLNPTRMRLRAYVTPTYRNIHAR